jgi:calcineurin-like phosphoesterase
MTGPHDGIIGVERSAALGRFLNAMPARFEAATGDAKLHAVVITADSATGRATAIERLSVTAKEVESLVGARP